MVCLKQILHVGSTIGLGGVCDLSGTGYHNPNIFYCVAQYEFEKRCVAALNDTHH